MHISTDDFHCKNCGGSCVCEHNHKRSLCKDCGGSVVCEHKQWRNLCKECGGSNYKVIVHEPYDTARGGSSQKRLQRLPVTGKHKTTSGEPVDTETVKKFQSVKKEGEIIVPQQP